MDYPTLLFPLVLLSFALLAACEPDIPESTNSSSSGYSITAMSFNIRYDNPNDGINRWDNRKDRVAELILFYEPMFLGTQEVLPNQLRYLDGRLSSYGWIGSGREGGDRGEFSALFYDTTRVRLVEGSDHTIWLSETPSQPSKSWDAALPRILTYGEFRLPDSDRTFFLFNTHFDHRGDTARLESARLVRSVIDSVSAGKPAILTGDFNATPGSKPYAALTSGDHHLRDAYVHTSLPHLGPSFTYEGFEVRPKATGRRIDYIFVNDRAMVQKHAIIASYSDKRYPSDHLPVLAEIILKGEPANQK